MNDSRNIRQRAFYYTHVAADPKNKDTRLRAQRGHVPVERRRQDHGELRRRRLARPVDRSRRSTTHRPRERRRRRGHVQRGVGPARRGRRGTTRRRSTTTSSRRRTCRITSAARSRTAAPCACRATRTWAGAAAAVADAAARRRCTARAAPSPATSHPDPKNPDIFYRRRQQRIVPDASQSAHRQAARGGSVPAHVLGRAVERTRRALAVDLPDRLLAGRSHRALHLVTARLEDDQRRPELGPHQRRSDASRSEDDGRPRAGRSRTT